MIDEMKETIHRQYEEGSRKGENKLLKIGIYFMQGTNQEYAREQLYRIANQYFDTEDALLIHRRDFAVLSNGDSMVEMFCVRENYTTRAKRFHKIYVDSRFNSEFIYGCLLPLAVLFSKDVVDKLELI